MDCKVGHDGATFKDFPDSSVGKESACNAGDLGSIPGLGLSLGEGRGYPLQYTGLKNSMDCIVHGGRKESDTTEKPSLTFIKLMLFSFSVLLSPSLNKPLNQSNTLFMGKRN